MLLDTSQIDILINIFATIVLAIDAFFIFGWLVMTME